MKALFVFIFIVLFFSQSKSDIRYLVRPVFVNTESPTFILRYDYQVINSKLPTLVFLQGGPGAPILFQNPSFLPSEFNILLIDPRGIGQSPILIQDPYSTSSFQIASDVAAILKEENISNYFIWGTSYGTVIGTILSSSLFINELQIPKPQALILEATVGRAFKFNSLDRSHENTIGLKNVTSLIEKDLPPNIKENLSNLFTSLNVSSDEFSHFLISILNSGKTLGISKLKSYLNKSPDFLSKEIKFKFNKSNQFFSTKAGQSLSTQLQYIACSELINLETFELTQFEFNFLSKKITNDSLLRECFIAPKKFNSFDSSLYQISETIPVFYFIAEDDPKTPFFQTLYHFNSQLNKNSLNRIFLLNKGGHAPFQNPEVAICRNLFFTLLAKNNPSLAAQETLSCLKNLKLAPNPA